MASLTYNSIIEKLKVSKLDLAPKIIAYAELNKHKLKSEWAEYQQLSKPFVETYCKTDHRRMNEVAYVLYERGVGMEILEQAEIWSKKCIGMVDNLKYNSTHAALLFRLGKKTEALTAINHALEIGKNAGLDIKQASLLRDKIISMTNE